jgi:hypothetical protein
VILIALFFVVYLVSVMSKDHLSELEMFRSGRHLLTIPFLLYFLIQPYISSYQEAIALWKSPTMQAPFVGFISAQGITYVSSANRNEMAWSKFSKKKVTDDLILLLTDDRRLSFFPRRFFKTDNDWRTVVQWVNSKVVEAK